MKYSANTGFFVKSPTGNRKSFSIISYEKEDGKKVNNKALRIPEVVKINVQYEAGELSFDQAKRLVSQIKDNLVQGVKDSNQTYFHNQENADLVEKYIKAKYRQQRRRNKGSKQKSQDDMRTSCLRAIKCLGAKSIYSATENYIQDCIDENFEGNVQRKMVSRMKQILGFIDRKDVQLEQDPEEHKEVRHLTLAEGERLLEELSKNRLVYLAAALTLYTGCRIGEVMHMTSASILSDEIVAVKRQRERKTWAVVPTKNRKERQSFTIKDVSLLVEEWEQLDLEAKKKARKGAKIIPREINKACRKLWPRNPEKHLIHHDLRHSYAIHLLQTGVPIDLVALSIGDTVEVCRKNYTGYILNDVGISTIASIMKK